MSAAGEELVEVADTGDQVEAELIQGLLGEAGIPSLLQAYRASNLRVAALAGLPLYGGGQRVLVHAKWAERARALLAETLVADESEPLPEPVAPSAWKRVARRLGRLS